MFSFSSLTKKGINKRDSAILLFIAGLPFCANAQEEKPNALFNYGESHPIVFILGILIAVALAVVVVFIFFKKTTKENSSTHNHHQRSVSKSLDKKYGHSKKPAVTGTGIHRR